MQHAVWVSIAVLGVAHVRFVTLNNDDDGNDSNHRDYYYYLCDTVVCLTGALVLSQVSVVPLCRVHYQQFFDTIYLGEILMGSHSVRASNTAGVGTTPHNRFTALFPGPPM